MISRQGWSYFLSLYFAYTSLLTIGYGDYSPASNSGKAFFVFWSLLAVPTLTILISNMGDTVIKAFRDLTIWVGSLTVLPGENGLSSTLSVGLRRLKHGKLHPPDEDGNGATAHGASEQRLFDRLAENLEEDELKQAAEVCDPPNDADLSIASPPPKAIR
jgi:potassium channel subfamily K